MNDKQYGWPTTRRYPRTLLEAFPQDCGPWFEKPPRFEGWRNKLMSRLGLVLWASIVYIYWRYL